MVFMNYMKNYLASIFEWLENKVIWKQGLPRPKVSYECLSPSPTHSLPKRRVFCNAKVIEDPLRVLFRFHSDKALFRFFNNRALFRVLSDRVFWIVLNDRILFESSVIGSSSGPSVIDSSVGSSVLFFRFFIKTCYYFFLINRDVLFCIIFPKWTTHLTISSEKKKRNTCMIQTRHVILKIYFINFPIYKWSILLNI